MVRRSGAKVETKLMTVTPEMAAKWLELNKGNRDVRPALVKMLTAEITNNRWQVTHQGIAFDEFGELLDGQHRLHAIVRADAAVPMYVSYGAPRASFAVVDGGANRSFRDRTMVAGTDVTPEHGAVARVIVMGPSWYGMVPYSVTVNMITKHREAIDFALSLKDKKYRTAAPILAVVARAWYTKDRTRLAEFMRAYNTGEAQSPADWAATRLRETILLGKTKGRHATNEREGIYYKAESAVDLFLRRFPATKLYGVKDELFPVPGEAAPSALTTRTRNLIATRKGQEARA